MQLVHFFMKVVINHSIVIKSVNAHNNHASIDISYNFSKQDVPSDTEITFHGISRRTAKKIKVGHHADIYAGFYNADYTANNIAHVLSAKITSLIPLANDSGDLTFGINIQDGDNYKTKKEIKVKQSKNVRIKSSNRSSGSTAKIRAYSKKQHYLRNAWLAQNPTANRHQKHLRYLQMENNIKSYRTQVKGTANRENKRISKLKTYRKKTVYKAMSFKPGTHGSDIIKTISKKSGIDIAQLKLVYNKVFISGYTAKKKPIQCIKDIAKECLTDLYYQHGKLVIKPFTDNPHLNYVCTKTSGLITPPNKSSDSGNKDTYQMTIIFLPKITVGSIFRVSDKFTRFHDTVIVTSGSATLSDSDSPIMDLNIKRLSTYKKEQAKALKKAKSKDAKASKKKEVK